MLSERCAAATEDGQLSFAERRGVLDDAQKLACMRTAGTLTAEECKQYDAIVAWLHGLIRPASQLAAVGVGCSLCIGDLVGLAAADAESKLPAEVALESFRLDVDENGTLNDSIIIPLTLVSDGHLVKPAAELKPLADVALESFRLDVDDDAATMDDPTRRSDGHLVGTFDASCSTHGATIALYENNFELFNSCGLGSRSGEADLKLPAEVALESCRLDVDEDGSLGDSMMIPLTWTSDGHLVGTFDASYSPHGDTIELYKNNSIATAFTIDKVGASPQRSSSQPRLHPTADRRAALRMAMGSASRQHSTMRGSEAPLLMDAG